MYDVRKQVHYCCKR